MALQLKIWTQNTLSVLLWLMVISLASVFNLEHSEMVGQKNTQSSIVFCRVLFSDSDRVTCCWLISRVFHWILSTTSSLTASRTACLCSIPASNPVPPISTHSTTPSKKNLSHFIYKKEIFHLNRNFISPSNIFMWKKDILFSIVSFFTLR